MKTTKSVLIAALLSFALMSFANTELGLSKNVISLKAAMANQQLAQAIYSQVKILDILNSERAGFYTAEIVLKKTVYLITGTYDEWNYFFRDIDSMSPLCTDIKKSGLPIDKGSLFSKKNPFGTSVKRPSPHSEKDPFGDKRKKPLPVEKGNKVLMDDE